MNAARISKVTDKRTGRSIHVLRRPEHPKLSGQLVEYARNIADSYIDGEIIAFAIVAFGRDGSHNRASRIDKDQPFGVTLLPAMVADVLRRDIAEDVVGKALVRNGLRRPPEDDPA